jgi:hypothetical protein
MHEFSMLSANLLGAMNIRLQQLFPEKEGVDFAGISVIFLGDPCQLPPVGAKSLVDPSNANSENALTRMGYRLWRSITQCIVLTEPMRTRNLQEFALLCRARMGGLTLEDCDLLNKQVVTWAFSREDATWILPRLADVHRANHNAMQLIEHQECRLWAATTFQHRRRGRMALTPGQQREARLRVLRTLDEPQCIVLKAGARVRLTTNVSVKLGLPNGATGTVHGYMSTPRRPWSGGLSLTQAIDAQTEDLYDVPIVLVKFDERFARHCDSYVRSHAGVVPIVAQQTFRTVQLSDGTSVTVIQRQLPLRLAFAMTIHASQGSTCAAVVTNTSECWEAGQAYVAVSRVRNLADLYSLAPIRPEHFCQHSAAAERLRSEVHRLDALSQATTQQAFKYGSVEEALAALRTPIGADTHRDPVEL